MLDQKYASISSTVRLRIRQLICTIRQSAAGLQICKYATRKLSSTEISWLITTKTIQISKYADCVLARIKFFFFLLITVYLTENF